MPILLLTLSFIVMTVGFAMFPSANDVVVNIDTTNMDNISHGINYLYPYMIGGAVLIAGFFIFKNRGQ